MKKISRSIEDFLLGPYKRRRKQKKLERFEEKKEPFSALNEEIILEKLITTYDVKKSYVDIGASDGVKSSNTARLALNGWSGICFDYNSQKVGSMAHTYSKLDNVQVCRAKILPTNIINFLQAYNVPKDLGVLSLDIDSYDYFVLEEMLKTLYRPSIIVTELNVHVPPPLKFTLLFDADFWWSSGRFQGYSLSMLETLIRQYDYALVHLERENAFLVSKEHAPHVNLSVSEAYEKGFLYNNSLKAEWYNKSCTPEYLEFMRILYKKPPEEIYTYIDKYFEEYKGKYLLSH